MPTPLSRRATLCAAGALLLLAGTFTAARRPYITASAAEIGAQNQQASLLLGPEILVSRNEPYAHVETTISAAPNSGKLIAATITLGGDYGVRNESYASTDGGNSWVASRFDNVFRVADDPQVAYAGEGNALFASNASLTEGGIPKNWRGVVLSGQHKWGVVLFGRSQEHSWSYVNMLPIADRPMLFVDNWSRRHRGAIYLSGMSIHTRPKCKPISKADSYDYNCIEYVIQAYRSDDGGSHFSGPFNIISGLHLGKAIGLNSVSSPQVLSDGRILYPFEQWPLKNHGSIEAYYISEGDAASMAFSTPHLIGVQHAAPSSNQHMQDVASGLVLAADHSGGPFHDHLYAAWSDFTGTGLRVVLSRSLDVGRTWSQPTEIAPFACANCLQYIPSIAVAPNGDVGVMWLDTRETNSAYSYDVYFAASVDGGRTFLPARRVTAVSSHVLNPGNLEPVPYFGAEHKGGSLSYSIVTAFSRFPAGGDYLSVTADSNSVFHLLWADSRSFGYQAYTTRAWTGVAPPREYDSQTPATDITAQVDVLFDPMTFDPATDVYNVPLRIRNISHHVLKPPFVVVTSQDFAEMLPGVSILNADNQVKSNGARLSYTETLRDVAALSPGAVTGARTWRLHVPSRDTALFNIPMRVYGRSAQ